MNLIERKKLFFLKNILFKIFKILIYYLYFSIFNYIIKHYLNNFSELKIIMFSIIFYCSSIALLISMSSFCFIPKSLFKILYLFVNNSF